MKQRHDRRPPGNRTGNSANELDDSDDLTTITISRMLYEIVPMVENIEKKETGIREEPQWSEIKPKQPLIRHIAMRK